MNIGTRWDNWVPGPTCGLSNPQGFTDAAWIMYMSQIIAETHATARAMWKEELERFVDGGELPKDDHLLGPNEVHQDIQNYLEFMGLLTTEDTYSNINAHRQLAEELARRAAEESTDASDVSSHAHARSTLEHFILLKLLRIFKPGSPLSPDKLWFHIRRRTRSIPKVIKRGALKHSKALLSSMRITRPPTSPTPSPAPTNREAGTPRPPRPPRRRTLSDPQPFTQKLETSKPLKTIRRMTVDDSKTTIAQKRHQEMTEIEDKKSDSLSLKSSSSATVIDLPLQFSSPILPSRSWQCSLRTMLPPEWIITPSPLPSPCESDFEPDFEPDSLQPSTSEAYPVRWYHTLFLIFTFLFVGISFLTFLLIRSVFCFTGISKSERFVNICIITGCVLSLGKFFQISVVHY